MEAGLQNCGLLLLFKEHVPLLTFARVQKGKQLPRKGTMPSVKEAASNKVGNQAQKAHGAGARAAKAEEKARARANGIGISGLELGTTRAALAVGETMKCRA